MAMNRQLLWCIFPTTGPLILLIAIMLYQVAITEFDEDELCNLGFFPCGNLSQCVAQESQCDDIVDCRNGADEEYHHCVDRTGYRAVFLELHGDRNITSINWSSCNLQDVPPACSCYHQTRLRCIDRGLDELPHNLSQRVTRLLLQKNQISDFPPGVFTGLGQLNFIHLFGNNLTVIKTGAFDGLDSLEKLFLSGNKIHMLEEGAFTGVEKLEWLFLDNNKLTNIPPGVLNVFKKLKILKLNNNQLTLKSPDPLDLTPNCFILDLKNNLIEEITSETLSKVTELQVLLLQRNRILHVSTQAFSSNQKLVHLDLSRNLIQEILPGVLSVNRTLANLNISYNPVTSMHRDVFANLSRLASLSLNGLRLDNIAPEMFSPLQNLKWIYFSSFQYCRYTPMVRVCEPKGDGISAFDNLLDMGVLRVCIWVVALITCSGNLLVMVCRMVIKEERGVHSLFIKNLCAADFMMGVYLIIIGSLDILFRDQYNRYALSWMSSWCCQATGFLAMMSCEVSILLLTYMSVERFVAIAFPYKPSCLNLRKGMFSLIIIWTLGAVLSALPIIIVERHGEFYGTNGVCFPLHIHDPFLTGWQYSAFVFIGLNFTAMLIISICYVGMFVSIQRTQRETQVSLTRDMSFAKRFFLIVLTDALCWIPIIIIKILAFAQLQISDHSYAWLTVFVLPINSAINPVLYSLTTTSFRRKMSDTVLARIRQSSLVERIVVSGRRWSARSGGSITQQYGFSTRQTEVSQNAEGLVQNHLEETSGVNNIHEDSNETHHLNWEMANKENGCKNCNEIPIK